MKYIVSAIVWLLGMGLWVGIAATTLNTTICVLACVNALLYGANVGMQLYYFADAKQSIDSK